MNQHNLLGQEWQTLQNNYEHQEKCALLIKLFGIASSLFGLSQGIALPWIAFSLALCWLLEGIFKTYQSRLGERLMRLEFLIKQEQATHEAMQLHSEWQIKRPGAMHLILDYLVSSCRPTVTIPYLPLLLGLGYAHFF